MGEDSNVISSLEIQITGTTEQAEQSVDRLTNSLTSLKNVLDSSKFGAFTKGLNSLATGFNNLSSALSGFDSVVRSGAIERAAAGIRRLTRIDTDKLKDIAKALAALKITAASPSGESGGASGLGTPKDSPLTEVGGEAAASTESVRRSFADAFASAMSDVRDFAETVSNTLGNAAKTVGAFAAKTALSLYSLPFRSVGNAAVGFAKKLGTLISSFKRILFYRVVRTMIKEIGDAFKTGVKDLYQWSDAIGGEFAKSMDMASTAMLYMKNSLGAMVAPLVNTLAPILDMLIDKFVALINVINQFFAIVTGATSWTKALKYPKAYAEETKKAGAAAKAALKYLAPFDELNVLPDQRNGGGGGGADALDYSKMFEEQKLDESLRNRFADIFDVFKEAWENNGAETVEKIKKAFGQIRDMFGAIGNSFREVFTNGTGLRTLETILSIVGNIAAVAGNMAEQFRIAWETNEVGTQIIQNLWDIANDYLSLLDRMASATAEWASGLDFYPLLASVEQLTGAFKRFAGIIDDAVGWAYENVLLPFGKWTIESALPVLISTLANAFQVLSDILVILQPPAQWLWEKFLEPLGKWAGGAFIGALGSVNNLLSDLHALLSGDKSLSEFLDNLSLGETVALAFATALTVVVGGSTILTGTLAALEAGLGILGVAFGVIASPIGIAVAAIAGLTAAGVLLYQNWDTISAKAGELWDGIKDAFKTGVNAVLGFAEGFANGIIDAFNSVVRFLNGFKFDVPEWVPMLGGKKFNGFGIKEKAHISIPRLEKGGVLDAGQLFIAREAGPELVGSVNGKNTVMNNDDIVRSVQFGVAEANTDVVNAIMTIGNMIVQAVESQDSDVTLDGRSLASGLRPYLKAIEKTHGASLVTVS